MQIFAAFLQSLRRFHSFLPFVFGAVDVHQCFQSLNFASLEGRKLLVGRFCTVVHTGLKIIKSKFGHGQCTFFFGKFGSINEETVQTNSTVKLTTAAEQIAERMVQFDRFGVQSHDFDKKVDGLVCLDRVVAQQKRKPFGIVLINALRRLFVLFEINPAQPPTGSKKNRDRNQIPEFEFHLFH